MLAKIGGILGTTVFSSHPLLKKRTTYFQAKCKPIDSHIHHHLY